MKIQPISSWQNGQEKLATEFILYSNYDNLSNKASFSYSLCEDISSNEPMTIASGQIYINGQDYIDWNSAPDVNAWAYTWAAAKLNLVLIIE
jgi:hypothetical protein